MSLIRITKREPKLLFPYLRLRTQRYFTGNITGGMGTTSFTADNLRAWPFMVGEDTSFDSIAIEITTGVAGNARIGIYEDNGLGYPGVLLVDSGNLDTSSAALKNAAITQTLKKHVLYWLVLVTSAAPTLRTQLGTINILGLPSTIGGTVTSIWAVSFTFAALPNPFSASATATTGNPPIFLKAA